MSLFGYDDADDWMLESDIAAPLSTLETLLRGFMLTHGNLVGSLPKREPMKRMARETYLDGEMCPPGTAPCTDDSCPEQGLNIYTASGDECYDAAVVRDARAKRVNELRAKSKKQPRVRDTRAMVVAARDLTEIVRAAAVLSSRIQGIGHANVACEGVNSLSNDEEKKRAFCGTLITTSGERRCKFDDAARTCKSIEGVTQPVVSVAAAPAASSVAAPSGPSEAEVEAARAARRAEVKAKVEHVAEERAAQYQETANELRQEEGKVKQQLKSLEQDNFKESSDIASYALDLLKEGKDLSAESTSTAADVTAKTTAAQQTVDQSREALTTAQTQIAFTVKMLKERGDNPLAAGADAEADVELEALRKDALLQVELFQGFIVSALKELPTDMSNLKANGARDLALKSKEHGAALKEQFDHVQTTIELYINAAGKSSDKQLKDEEKLNWRAIKGSAAKLSSGEMNVYPALLNLSKSLAKSECLQEVTALKAALQASGTAGDKSERLSAVIAFFKDNFLALMMSLQDKMDAISEMYAAQLAAAEAKLAAADLSVDDRNYYTVVTQIAPVIIAEIARKRSKLNKFAEQPLPAGFTANMEEVKRIVDAASASPPAADGEKSSLRGKVAKVLSFGAGVSFVKAGIALVDSFHKRSFLQSAAKGVPATEMSKALVMYVPPEAQSAFQQFWTALGSGAQVAYDYISGIDPVLAAKVVGGVALVASLGWAARSFYKKRGADARLIVVKGNDIDVNASLANIIEAFTLAMSKLKTVYDHVSLMPTITDKTSLQLQANGEAKSIAYQLDTKRFPKNQKLDLKKLNTAQLALLSVNPRETLKGYDVDCDSFNKVFKNDPATQGRVCRTGMMQGDVDGGVPKCAYSEDEDAGKDASIQPNRCYPASDYNPKTTYASASDSYSSRYSSYAYLESNLAEIMAAPEDYGVTPEQLAAITAIDARLKVYKSNNVPFRLSREEFDLYSSLVQQGHYTTKEKRFPKKFTAQQ